MRPTSLGVGTESMKDIDLNHETTAMAPTGDALNSERRAAIGDFAQSDLFERTFADGMALVEETASYLDGPGREQSKTLTRKGALAYAGESMRLTTRLMQVASWLLVQKAIREDDMTPEEACQEKYRLGAQEICRGAPLESVDELPETLMDLLERSERLYDRVDRLDAQMYRRRSQEAEDRGPSVEDQRSLLQRAFGAGGE